MIDRIPFGWLLFVHFFEIEYLLSDNAALNVTKMFVSKIGIGRTVLAFFLRNRAAGAYEF